MENTFIKSEVWSLTIAGAYQRVKIYRDDLFVGDIDFFESQLKNFVMALEAKHYKKVVSSEKHLENIEQLASFFRKSGVLDENVPAFGIAQKFLNLYLKYVWCLGEIKEPPHFPIDRSIQKTMGIPAEDILAWTKIVCRETYMQIINLGQKLRGDTTLAHFELRLFNEKMMVA
ncbi:hypothetical protein [Arcticibacterium luteifluviistationis]|uniref:Uncharacterized protein n=1 Tax=Arcticibacterium luteifluviistationis TaxID=1784714 RepID=A0A2Z4G773_9BACT|nr:hypothetical protein [Arcticibacterium luteifluviistationis]AWV97022.1 hypothetical protein DJ013_02050 [Arcticibacterium luteifluviistationis]